MHVTFSLYFFMNTHLFLGMNCYTVWMLTDLFNWFLRFININHYTIWGLFNMLQIICNNIFINISLIKKLRPSGTRGALIRYRHIIMNLLKTLKNENMINGQLRVFLAFRIHVRARTLIHTHLRDGWQSTEMTIFIPTRVCFSTHSV